MTWTPMRGRVVVREIKERSSVILDPGVANEREIVTHRGVVLAKGAPVLLDSGVEVPHFFEVGDIVQFHFEATEKGRTAPWEDGEEALYLAQREIDAVIHDGECTNPCEEAHVCPYQFEIHGSEDLCNCCDKCEHDCAWDI